MAISELFGHKFVFLFVTADGERRACSNIFESCCIENIFSCVLSPLGARCFVAVHFDHEEDKMN